jgi:hypothetical protein
MLGWTHKVNRSHWLRLKVLAFAVVATAVFAGAASARPDEGSALLSKASEIPYLSHGTGLMEQGAGGVTPTNLARAYEPLTAEESALIREIPYLSHGTGVLEQGVGGVTPTNLARAYVPRTVDEPALIRDVPDGVQGDVGRAVPTTSFVSDNGGSFDESAMALGFGLGLALSVIAAIVLMLSRSRMRVAHS